MHTSESFYTEFLAESNIALNQDGERSHMELVVEPIKHFLQEKKRTPTAYSLARSSGANSQLAFFAEYVSFAGQMMQNLGTLTDYTYDTIMSSFAPEDRVKEEVQAKVLEVCQGELLTLQIAYVNQKIEQFRFEAYTKNPHCNKYFTSTRFQKILANESLLHRTIASQRTSLAQYLDTLASGFTYFTIALPMLMGISSSISAKSDTFESSEVAWTVLESILVNISLLVRISRPLPLALYIKENLTSDVMAWFLASETERADLAMSDNEVLSQIKEIREKVIERTGSDITALVLPDTLKSSLISLFDWAVSLNVSEQSV